MVDITEFYKNCSPTRTLDLSRFEDQNYYIDFSTVRGGDVIQALKRSIAIQPTNPSCGVFSGHRGCGKSTELLRLKAQLQEDGFYVVYVNAEDELSLEDIDVTDVLLAITHRVSEDLRSNQIQLDPPKALWDLFWDLITSLDLSAELKIPGLGKGQIGEGKSSLEFSFLPGVIGSITAKSKSSDKSRDLVRQHLEPRTSKILKGINEEVLKPAINVLAQQGKQGLVVIVDNLDRISARTKGDKPQTEYLFIDRAEQMRGLDCHLIYTAPLPLLYSSSVAQLIHNLLGDRSFKMLPLVPVRSRDGKIHIEGINLLKRMVLVRAFPELKDTPEKLFEHIPTVFDSPETLERLCYISGGHVRNLQGLVSDCLDKIDTLPISHAILESVIQERRDILLRGIEGDEMWSMILDAAAKQSVAGPERAQTLLANFYLFKYWDQSDWYGINPLLEETKQFQNWLANAAVAS